MAKSERIKVYSAEDLRQMQAAGEDRSDWAKVDAMSQTEVERLADEEDGPLPEGWESSIVHGLPPGKEAVKLRIDRDVLAWFRGSGKGYQTRINAALRAFVQAHQRDPR